MKSEMYVCLVCHTEPDVWNGGFGSIDTVLPKFQKMVESIRDHAGTPPRVAWCLTSQVLRQRSRPFLRMVEFGHEVGVHSHFSQSENGRQEHDQELNRKNLDNFSTWFPNLCSEIVAAGFPAPCTHATWMFAYRDYMTKVLGDSGIRVDCSVCYGGAHYLEDGFLLADSRNRICGKPYRLSEDNHCMEGNSSVVELPVSGGLGCYWEPDKTGKFEFFSPVSSEDEMERQLHLFQHRLDALCNGEIDIFHIHFHLYEFTTPKGLSYERLARAKKLLDSMIKDPRVRFLTPSAAVDKWIRRRINIV